MQREALSKALSVKQIEQQLASALEEEGAQHEKVLALDAEEKEIEDKVSYHTRAAHSGLHTRELGCAECISSVWRFSYVSSFCEKS